MNKPATYRFTVTGMQCGNCSMLIDQALEDTDGVHRAQTSVRAGHTVVDADPAIAGPADLIAVIAAAGYTATLDPH